MLGLVAVVGNGWEVAEAETEPFQGPMAAERIHQQSKLTGNNPVAVAGAAVESADEALRELAQ